MAIPWKNRRLTHVLCASPIHELLVRSFYKHYGELFDSDNLEKCIMESKTQVAGFNCMDDQNKQAAFSVISTVSCNNLC